MTLQEKNNAINDLYKLNIPRKVWRYKTNFDDFSQYCYLQIMQIPDEKFASLLEQGQLVNYFYILCKWQASNNSHFWSEYAGKIDFIYYEENNNIERETEDYFE